MKAKNMIISMTHRKTVIMILVILVVLSNLPQTYADSSPYTIKKDTVLAENAFQPNWNGVLATQLPLFPAK